MNIKEKAKAYWEENQEGILMLGIYAVGVVLGTVVGYNMGEALGISETSRYYTQMAIMANRGR